MSTWLDTVLARMAPEPDLPPLPAPVDEELDERHAANLRLADAWQRRLDQDVDELRRELEQRQHTQGGFSHDESDH